MHAKACYDVGIFLYPNDIQCLTNVTARYIVIHSLLISVTKIFVHVRIAGKIRELWCPV